jgi:hypothetical protein
MGFWPFIRKIWTKYYFFSYSYEPSSKMVCALKSRSVCLTHKRREPIHWNQKKIYKKNKVYRFIYDELSYQGKEKAFRVCVTCSWFKWWATRMRRQCTCWRFISEQDTEWQVVHTHTYLFHSLTTSFCFSYQVIIF